MLPGGPADSWPLRLRVQRTNIAFFFDLNETAMDFDAAFGMLTGNPPFPWQRELYHLFIAGDFLRLKSCNLPTGLGKTSVIPIWTMAVAANPAAVPRRLVYVVNRRTVVDQATAEAERMRRALRRPELEGLAEALRLLAAFPSKLPLAISTLRGQFADNAEWRNDPARPAVIIGTVDMIGSRLLFAGYGCGFKSRPLHAGFLGQDTLLVHDEAHLEPAFQQLVTAIEEEQTRCREFRPLRVMALTATSRSDGEQFSLTIDDRNHEVVRKRIEAKKWMTFRPVEDEKKIADEAARCALKHRNSGQRILVFLRKLQDVQKVATKLSNEVGREAVQILTGTLRGLERDGLAKADPVFARFMPRPTATPRSGTVYLVCTSAGEVGVDISADHLVCDLTPFDSMAQRFGRVNRYGGGEASLDIVHEAKPDDKKKDDRYEQARWRTLEMLQRLPQKDHERYSASPAALGDLPAEARHSAFTPPPAILPVSDILFDAWALTSVREKLPGRPPVAEWLHGIAEWEPPETYIAWREEVECLSSELLGTYKPEDLLEDYPLKPHEVLRDRTAWILDQLEQIADRCPDLPAWMIEPDGEIRVLSLGQLTAEGNQNNLADCTVLLPPSAGGLDAGILNGSTAYDAAQRDLYDVSDQWFDDDSYPRRARIWNDDRPPAGMRLVRTIAVPNPADEADADEHRYWYWYVRPRSADDDGSRSARARQELGTHLKSAEDFARALVDKLGLTEPEASGIISGSARHDYGKNRRNWQRSIGNHEYPDRVLAKSGRGGRLLDLNDYRHELGSLIDLENGQDAEFRKLNREARDLALHGIAAHHGRARPHFPANEAFDPERKESEVAAAVREVPRRFARLQRKYGRWGLAYLESLVRAADALASQGREEDDLQTVPVRNPEVAR